MAMKSILVLTLVIVTGSSFKLFDNDAREKSCTSEPVDLALLIDSSASIIDSGSIEMTRVKNFVKKYLENYDISKQGTHVAIIQYSTKPKLLVKFGTYDKDVIYSKIDSIYAEGNTYINLALHMANKKVFTKKAGMRDGVKRVLVLFTDGVQSKYDRLGWDLVGPSNKMKNRKNVKIYTLGVGNVQNEKEKRIQRESLVKISSGDGYHLFAKSFDKLSKIAEEIVQKQCEVVTTQPPTTEATTQAPTTKATTTQAPTTKATTTQAPTTKATTTQAPTTKSTTQASEKPTSRFEPGNIAVKPTKISFDQCQRVDVALLLDSSNSLNNRQWNELIEFTKRAVEAYTIGPKDTHISIIRYNRHPKLLMKFNSLQEKELNNENVNHKLETLPKYTYGSEYGLNRMFPYIEGLTFIDRAFEMANTQVFTKEAGMRSDVLKVCILLTDGRQTTDFGDYTTPHEAAKPLKEKGVQIITVGLGSRINAEELEKTASSPELSFHDVPFDQLKQKAQDIALSACKA